MKSVGEKSLGGRPPIPEEQYKIWLEELRPFLVKGMKLYSSCTKLGLAEKYFSCIYPKYKAGDWFSKKIHEYHSVLGDTINEFFADEVLRISDKQRLGERLTNEDIDIMKFMASNHRSAQLFFTQHIEKRKTKENEIGKIIQPVNIVCTKL